MAPELRAAAMSMNLWHQTPDAPVRSIWLDGKWWLEVVIGTWPIEAGQSVTVERVDHEPDESAASAEWQENRGSNSYWRARVGPYDAGQVARYRVQGHVSAECAVYPFEAKVGRNLHVAFLWHNTSQCIA